MLTTASTAPAQSATSQDPSFQDRAAAYHAFILGRSLEGGGDIDGAVDAYEQAAELDPGASGIWSELAALYARQNQADEAIRAGNTALERDPDDNDAHRILGLVYAARAGSRDAPSPDDIDRAVTHLERARNPQAPDAGLYITLGRLYVSTRQPDKAIAILTEILDVEPQFTDALVMLARAHESRGEWDEAAAAYERAVLYSPRRTRYRRQMANALVNAGQPERARAALQELVRIRPQDADGWYALADLELDLDDYDAAEAAARQVLDLEPDSVRGAYALSRALGGKREYRALVDELTPVVSLARENDAAPGQVASLLQRLSVAHQSLGEFDLAAATLRDALDLVPSNLGLQVQLVQVYLEAGRLDDAAQLVARAQEGRPANLALMRLEAQMLSARGELGDAVAVLE
ncbi:MAG: tetratricopeptide repeat protein, partial [Acidobacteriota bacterium]|nr:tetratricopeptide repeat protein [Acidobacteriota bacterium]